MDSDRLERVASLLRERNSVDAQLAALIGRPALVGHLGEWIAAQVFDLELEASATAKAIDGRFRSGPLKGRTVNVKYYGKREGILDTTDDPRLDYYLVMTGETAPAASSKGKTRPFVITNVYLFDAAQLRPQQRAAGLRSGIASSVRSALWAAAEVFPQSANPALSLTSEQGDALARFGAA